MKIFLLTISSFLGIISMAQDSQFSQFYANPLYLNPAMAGTAPDTRAGINHRILWPGLPQAFTSSTVSIDHHSAPLQSSFGLMFHQDSEGTAELNNTTVSFTYGYEAHLHDELVLRPAVQFGYAFRGFDPSRLVFGDELASGGVTSDPGLRIAQVRDYWDFSTGVLLYTTKYWIGAAAHHLTQPNLSLIRGEDDLSIRYTVHFGTRIPLGNKVFRGKIYPTVAPSMLYKRQGPFQQFNAGASFHLQPVIFGLYYRGLPFLSDSFQAINHDAVIVQLGLDYFNFEFGYSFDISLSRLDPVTAGGAHEIALQYRFSLPYHPKKIPKRARRLPCPAFVHSLAY